MTSQLRSTLGTRRYGTVDLQTAATGRLVAWALGHCPLATDQEVSAVGAARGLCREPREQVGIETGPPPAGAGRRGELVHLLMSDVRQWAVVGRSGAEIMPFAETNWLAHARAPSTHTRLIARDTESA